jgi:hypothetical protein
MDVERRNQHFYFDYSFLNSKLGSYHVTIDLFETIDTSKPTIILQLNQVLQTNGLNVKIIA